MVEQLSQGNIKLVISPFVHIFEINQDTKCLFNSMTLKKVYLPNRKFMNLLVDIDLAKKSNSIKKLIRLNFLVPEGFNPEQVFNAVGAKLLKKKPYPNISYVLVTDFCNFRCGYCFIENSLKGPSIVMSKDLADKVIEVIIDAAKHVKDYRVIFYGGEPLSNSEIVFYITEKLQQASKSKFLFSCLTNGSFVTEDIAKNSNDTTYQ
jgi:sulfatase maturation enzyme AslB (radical SAM superfamily)